MPTGVYVRSPRPPIPTAERFEKRYIAEPMSGCWIWLGSLSSGYGHISTGPAGKNVIVQAHAFSYELLHGPVPPGLELDHLCRVRCCVNPYHVEPVTHQINILRGEGLAAANSKKTHCPNGHPLSGDNLRLWKGRRCCKTCRIETLKTWRANRKSLYCRYGHELVDNYCPTCNRNHGGLSNGKNREVV